MSYARTNPEVSVQDEKCLEFLMRKEVLFIFQQTWKSLGELNTIENNFPGNYLIAWTHDNLKGKMVHASDVFYVGMSNARKGLKSRLKQFLEGTNGKSGIHSGGYRFFVNYQSTSELKLENLNKSFYFVEYRFSCNVHKDSRTAANLLVMGKVCLFEFELLAYIKDVTGKEPILNKK